MTRLRSAVSRTTISMTWYNIFRGRGSLIRGTGGVAVIRSPCKMIKAAAGLGATSVIQDAGLRTAINQMDTQLPLIKSDGSSRGTIRYSGLISTEKTFLPQTSAQSLRTEQPAQRLLSQGQGVPAGLAGPENELMSVQGGKQKANSFLVPSQPTLHWDLVFECLSSISVCSESWVSSSQHSLDCWDVVFKAV